VALRKLKMPMTDIREILDTIRAVSDVQPVSVAAHDRALDIHERYGISLYDSVLVATALIAGNKTLYSEDLQHGQLNKQTTTLVSHIRSRLTDSTSPALPSSTITRIGWQHTWQSST
jgi:predicted nucleic acid-binding protein